MMKLALLSTLVALSGAALAADPPTMWAPTSTTGVPPSFQAWHPEFEKDGDYGETWFFVSQGDDGGAVFAMLSITNLGLRTFDGSVDVQYYGPDGQVHVAHHEVRRDRIEAATDHMDVTVGTSRAWADGDTYHLAIDQDDVSMRLDMTRQLPAWRPGDGFIRYGDGDHQALGIHVPRGRSSGSLTIDGQTFDLAGTGYHDHSWATIKLPSAMKRWDSLRLYHPRYTLVLHEHGLTNKYGGGTNQFGILGLDGRIVAEARSFTYAGSAPRKVKGGQMATELDVLVDADGWRVEGTIVEERYQDSVDVLGQLSLPVRLAIKAFYTNPFLHRYVGHYELDVTDPSGTTEHISGSCLVELDTY